MIRSVSRAGALAFALLGGALAWSAPAAAQSVMQQCGQQYQAAKASNTLNGATWSQYRTECAARLKATPAVQTGAPPAATPTAAPGATVPANPLKPAATTPAPAAPQPAATTATAPAMPSSPTAAATTAGGKPMSAGRTAFVARERQCGGEWKANKVTLIAQTPGLTWPKYLSQCNTRLKAAGQ